MLAIAERNDLVPPALPAVAPDGAAADPAALAPAVYTELRRVARAYMRHERPDHTLQPTALVHEALLRLAGVDAAAEVQSPGAFLALAARAMRRVLVDHARRRRAAKRRWDVRDEAATATVGLAVATPGADAESLDLLALDAALARLAVESPRAARVVELRFFAGLDVDAVAAVLGVGSATVKRDWALARAWLRRALAESD